MSAYLFAYGTLQPGCVPAAMAPVTAKLRIVGEGWVRGVLYNLGSYPGAIPDTASEQQIFGTVLELPEDETVLARLDSYEGYDPQSPETSEYLRETQRVELKGGGELECWFYRYNGRPDAKSAIAGGRWQRDREQTSENRDQ